MLQNDRNEKFEMYNMRHFNTWNVHTGGLQWVQKKEIYLGRIFLFIKNNTHRNIKYSNSDNAKSHPLLPPSLQLYFILCPPRKLI